MTSAISWVGRRAHRGASAILPRLRAWLVRVFLGLSVTKLGAHVKFRGLSHCDFGKNFRVGDFCWIEAVTRYGNDTYLPTLRIGHDVAISDLTHISCLIRIDVGDGCLLGSKIYIGDHSHGHTSNLSEEELAEIPARRKLADAAPIVIGARSWIGDGAVILGGTQIAAGSIVAANSVVRLTCNRPALIAGAPARVVRYLDSIAV